MHESYDAHDKQPVVETAPEEENPFNRPNPAASRMLWAWMVEAMEKEAQQQALSAQDERSA